jgi:DUF1680 family protein
LPGYFYSTSRDGLYVYLFHNSELNWHLENGTWLKVIQKTNYPWQGMVEIEVSPSSPAEFTVYVRIPGWSERSSVTVNGKAVPGGDSGRYLPLRRRWASGDVNHPDLEMSPQILEANTRVVEDNGRVAVQRGPLVYCLEHLDQPAGVALAEVALLTNSAKPEKGFSDSFEQGLLEGVVVLHHEGVAVQPCEGRRALYFPSSAAAGKTTKVPLTFIPYYAWANRAPTPMLVWAPVLKS